jgi:hypothetical protein
MRAITLNTSQSFAKEFARCCKNYSKLSMAVAWCGDPIHTLPYQYLKKFNGDINAIIGTSFNHTHPDAIDFLMGLGCKIRIFRNDGALFHPKVYLFSDSKHYSLFIGSSNLTYSGFYSNIEINALHEGILFAEDAEYLNGLQDQFNEWEKEKWSFKPTSSWIKSYRKAFKQTKEKEHDNSFLTPANYEDTIGSSSWLAEADWNTYYEKVLEGIKQRGQYGPGYKNTLDAAANNLPLPWRISYLQNLENRRIIGGIKGYGSLGHVSASGQFQHLLANGSTAKTKDYGEYY